MAMDLMTVTESVAVGIAAVKDYMRRFRRSLSCSGDATELSDFNFWRRLKGGGGAMLPEESIALC